MVLISAIVGGLLAGVAAAFVVALIGSYVSFFEYLIYPMFWIFALAAAAMIAYRAIGR